MPVNTKNLDEARAEIVAVLKRRIAEAQVHASFRFPSNPGLSLLSEHLWRILATEYPSDRVKSNRREQYANALVCVTDFFEANDFPPFVVHRFQQLVQGFRRLDKGEVEVVEWLKPAPGAWNKHVDPPWEWHARCVAAIALDVLATPNGGGSLAEQIAKIYTQLFPKNPVSAAAVKKWRERFKHGVVKDSNAVLLFEKREMYVKKARESLELRNGISPSALAIAEFLLKCGVD